VGDRTMTCVVALKVMSITQKIEMDFTTLSSSNKMELPNDILTVITDFSKPLKRRTVASHWDETTEEDMLHRVEMFLCKEGDELRDEGQWDYHGETIGIGVERYFDDEENEWTFYVNAVNLESEDEICVFKSTFTREQLYLWDAESYDPDDEESEHNLTLCESEDIVTQLLDENGKVIRTI